MVQNSLKFKKTELLNKIIAKIFKYNLVPQADETNLVLSPWYKIHRVFYRILDHVIVAVTYFPLKSLWLMVLPLKIALIWQRNLLRRQLLNGICNFQRPQLVSYRQSILIVMQRKPTVMIAATILAVFRTSIPREFLMAVLSRSAAQV